MITQNYVKLNGNPVNDVRQEVKTGDTIVVGQLLEFTVKEHLEAKEIGPCETARCPHCRNSLQNCEPHNSPTLRCCATCKEIFSVVELSQRLNKQIETL